MTKARNLSDLLDTNGKIDNNDIANIDASKIVSGDIAAARLTLASETKPTVSSVSPTIITNNATDITITGTDFTAIPRVEIINTATGIWYSANTVTHNSSTSLTVNVTLPVDAGTYRIRVENPDGLAGLSSANFLTVSDAPVWTTSAGSLGTVNGNTNGAVATVAATGDSITYSEVTNVLTNASLANCSLNSSTGAITSTDFDGSSTTARTHTFTLRATDAQGQTADREFSLTSNYGYQGDFLVVAGGGSGGYLSSAGHVTGGGGAGGLQYLTNQSLLSGVVYTITVGLGGTGGTDNNNGQNSSISGSGMTTITSIGGGHGGSTTSPAPSGGSGGGGHSDSGSGGSGTSGQGNSGGSGANYGGRYFDGGGGGGSGGAGASSTTVNIAGAGGNGTSNSITGSAVDYAGGGGGAARDGVGGTSYSGAGKAGGGNGGNELGSRSGGNATANTGSGGGGMHTYGGQAGNGGSGVVILRVPTANYSNTTTGSPTVTTDGSDTVIKFTASGTYTA